ncbi:hypothetical protein LTR53_001953, partial [Teratosphaeriaceae sp. CCFEE 6253]
MVQSRPLRVLPRSADKEVAVAAHELVTKPLRPHQRTTIPTPEPENDTFSDEAGPPAKRRKVSLKHKQTTLDEFAVTQSDAPKPPNSVTAVGPHGPLVETINGVRTTLDADLDDVAAKGSSLVVPERLPPPPASPPEPLPPQQAAAGAEKKEEKRTLRSHDEGSRVKSELAVYFSDYEEIVFGPAKKVKLITVDTALYITDGPVDEDEYNTLDSTPSSPQAAESAAAPAPNGLPPPIPPRATTLPFNGCPVLDLTSISRHTPHHPTDPLDDPHFLKPHRRAERREKQLRNIEKER